MVTDEEKAFAHCYGDLSHGVSSPDMVATDLYSQGILTSSERDQVQNMMLTVDQRTNHLLRFMEVHIRHDPRAFHVMLSVLRNEPAFQCIADKLEATLKGSVIVGGNLFIYLFIYFCFIST